MWNDVVQICISQGYLEGTRFQEVALAVTRFTKTDSANTILHRKATRTVDDWQTSEETLHRLVNEHKVCWQVWPLRHVDLHTGMRTIGYRLELLGTHHHPEHVPGPGCDECVSVYMALKRIAEWIQPKEKRDSVYRIQIFDHAMRFSPRRRFRKDVELVIVIQHRIGLTDPVDACEAKCLQEMEQNLKRLGARRNQW